MGFYKPYWYQQEAVDSVFSALSAGLRRILIVAPTGSGKSVMAAYFCEQAIQRKRGAKTLVVSSFSEILKQDYETIKKQLPQVGIGLYSAKLKCKTIDQVTVAGIGSIYKKPQLFEDFDYVIVDEAHLVSFDMNTMYRKFLDRLGLRSIGLTATHFRLKGGYLHKGKNAYFESISYEITIPVLQKERRLCQVIAQGSEIHLDASKHRKQAGDFVLKELSLSFDREEITKRIASDLAQFKETRNKWLGFGIDTKHCDHIAFELRALGIKAFAYHSKLTERVRAQLMANYKEGLIQCLVSVAMLTTGFDVKPIDLVFCVRHTDSLVLHIQMPGRGMRVCEGKKDLLYLDYANNLLRNGPIDNPKVLEPGEKKKKGTPVLKECEECFLIVPVSVRACPRCGTEFKFKHKLESVSSNAVIVSKGEWHKVNRVRYSLKNSRKGRVPMLMVLYQSGLRSFVEYVLFNHSGYPRSKAHRWWETRFMPDSTWIPQNSEEALEYSEYLKTPNEIYVDEKGKYPQINDYLFGGI